jgi:dihydroorotate dehydrogenase
MNWLLTAHRIAYERIIRPMIFLTSAQSAHTSTMRMLSAVDRSVALSAVLSRIHHATFEPCEIEYGSVRLPHPLILAAGFVKGAGFQTEAEALAAVEQGRNIIPGWRAVPRLVGLIEYGSFTRYPRIGNPGTVVWRDEHTRSTQNRVGLKNPGAVAAAEFLSQRAHDLPPQFGINIALSPSVADPVLEETEVSEAVHAFLSRRVYPTWFTLNLSCPNTDDDPSGNQTEAKAQRLCSAVLDVIRSASVTIPLWVKIGPDLSREQYALLMRVFHEIGVRAVIATNTLAQPAPDNPQVSAGVGGGRLHAKALEAARFLSREKAKHSYAVDVVGCGGILDAAAYQNYRESGIQVVQYWSALVYRGPLAAAIVADEARYDAGR